MSYPCRFLIQRIPRYVGIHPYSGQNGWVQARASLKYALDSSGIDLEIQALLYEEIFPIFFLTNLLDFCIDRLSFILFLRIAENM